MANSKFIVRTYTDAKTGKKYQKQFRVNDDYKLREKGGYDDALKQNYTEAFQEQPSLGKTAARGALPSVLGGIFGAASGRMNAGQSATAFGGQGLASAANAFANYQNRVNPNSKAAAVGSGALSTGANMFRDASQQNMARGASTGQSLLSGLGAGVQGLAQGALGAMPGGSSLGAAAPSLLQGIVGSIASGDPSKLLGGLQGAFSSVLSSKTLGDDIGKLFTKSEAKDYAGGTWGQGSGVDDLSDDEQAASNEAYLTENQPSVRSDMPTDFDGNAKDWMADDNADARQDVQEQNQMDAYNDTYDATLEKGGSESEARDAASQAQAGFQKSLSLDDIDQMTDNQFVTPTFPDDKQAAEGTDATQAATGDTGTGDTSGTSDDTGDQSAAAQPDASAAVPVGTEAAGQPPQAQAQAQAQPLPPQQPPEVQAAQRLPGAKGRGRVPAPPPPPPPQQFASPQTASQTANAFARGYSGVSANQVAETLGRRPAEQEARVAAASQIAQARSERRLQNERLPLLQQEALGEVQEQERIAQEKEAQRVAPTQPEAVIQRRGKVAGRRPTWVTSETPPGEAPPAPAPEAAAPPAEAAEGAPAEPAAFAGLGKNDKDEYTWGRGAVPSFSPIEPKAAPDFSAQPDYTKMSLTDISAENARLEREMDDELKASSTEGSTNYYNENPEKFEFLDGYGHMQEKAAALAPETIFSAQGDEDYEKPRPENSVTDEDGNIFIRTPLGMLKVGDVSGKPLPEQYRKVVGRLQTFLSANQSNPSADFGDIAERLYNQLPPEEKGYTHKVSDQSKAESMRNAQLELSGKMNPAALKKEMQTLAENARKWKMSSSDLKKLRILYKQRKADLKKNDRKVRGVFEGEDIDEMVTRNKREEKEARLITARTKAERGESAKGMTIGERIAHQEQRELEQSIHELSHRDKLQHRLAELQDEAKGIPEMDVRSPEAQKRDDEMKRLNYLIGRSKLPTLRK